jgi:hypothetical protein
MLIGSPSISESGMKSTEDLNFAKSNSYLRFVILIIEFSWIPLRQLGVQFLIRMDLE